MRTLAIETATEACSIALFEGETLIASDHRVLGRGHAELLIPMIAAFPDKGRAERVIVSLGPGSFTGVRIGIATARALGFAWRASVFGYPTLALVAAQARAAGANSVTVCMTGGHGEWFIQDFGPGGQPLNAMASLAPDAAVARGSQPHIAGSKAANLAELLGRGIDPLQLLPDAARTNLLDDSTLTTQLAPIYGRSPDATPQTVRRAS